MTFHQKTLNRLTTFPALAVFSFAATLFATTFAIIPLTTTSASAAGAQYCIARGGVNGDASYVGNCIYSDYQQCIQAAAESRGNCVGNIEYRAGAASAPATRRGR